MVGCGVKETPKGIPEGQAQGAKFPMAMVQGLAPGEGQRDSGPAASRVATNEGRASHEPEETPSNCC